MASRLLGRAALFIVAVQALVYPESRPTDAVAIPLNAQSPRPTTPPALHQYLKRGSTNGQTVLVAPDNTCGYVSGQSAAAYTCVDKTNLCVFVTAFEGGPGAAGCCDSQQCGFRIACLDFDQISTSSLCDSQCLTDTFTEKCTASGAPYCNTIAFPGSITDYFCNSLSISTAQAADTTFSGETGRTYLQTVIQLTSTTSYRPRPTTTPSSSSRATTTVTAAPPPPTDSSSSSSTPVGPIVGGVVGGVAVLALIGLGLFYFLRQNGNTPPPPQPPPAPETSQAYSNGNLNGNIPPTAAAAAGTGYPSSAELLGSKQGHVSSASTFPPVSPYSGGSPPPQQPFFTHGNQNPDPNPNRHTGSSSMYYPSAHTSTSTAGYPNPNLNHPHASPQLPGYGQFGHYPAGAGPGYPPPPPAEMDGTPRPMQELP